MAEVLSAVKGMNDIVSPESDHWGWLESQLQQVVQRYAFRGVRTPIVEPTGLYVRGLGEVTDIVEKEMYSFEDRLNGEALTLRPEGSTTPRIVGSSVAKSMSLARTSAPVIRLNKVDLPALV